VKDGTMLLKRVKCPKCRSRKLCLKEHFNVSDYYEFGKYGLLDQGIAEHDPVRVSGECLKCGHDWTFRGILQVTELVQQ